MPYKNKRKQREAVRRAVRKHKQKKREELKGLRKTIEDMNKQLYNDLSKQFPTLFPKRKKKGR